MKTLISAAVLSLALAGPALAGQCPADMAKIDAALKTASLTDAEKAKVIELRNTGEQQHSSGQHQQSVKTLAEAKKMLGIM